MEGVTSALGANGGVNQHPKKDMRIGQFDFWSFLKKLIVKVKQFI